MIFSYARLICTRFQTVVEMPFTRYIIGSDAHPAYQQEIEPRQPKVPDPYGSKEIRAGPVGNRRTHTSHPGCQATW